jgi:5-methylthioadenosine/S-adenosylhomocysteine deaminase
MSALARPAGSAVSPAVGRLPARSNVLIRNAYVMTMVPGAADLPNGDLRVANGEIAEVGTGLSAPAGAGDVQIIDGQGFILMPGLVDTHWHMWTTLLRNMAGNTPEHGYFPTTTAIGNVYTPRDMYYGTLLSAAEALFSGITTVHDWATTSSRRSMPKKTCAHSRKPASAAASAMDRRGGCRRSRRSMSATSRASPATGRAFPTKAC